LSDPLLQPLAQQLKLAPRQVKALEEDDFQRLPGRTFVRGFARNYARFVQLDPEAVLALLPAPESSSSLERPALASERRPMGEIPVERVNRSSAARWLVALLILAVIAGAAFYEYTRQRREAATAEPAGTNTAVSAAPAATADPASSAAPGTVTTALPNPVSESPSGLAPAPGTLASSPAAAAGTSPPGSPASMSADASANAALVLTFKGTSWAEVKDATGRVILQMTGGAGMTQTVTGSPPLELALGNARDVTVTFRGQSLDLGPYTRGLVARVSLR